MGCALHARQALARRLPAAHARRRHVRGLRCPHAGVLWPCRRCGAAGARRMQRGLVGAGGRARVAAHAQRRCQQGNWAGWVVWAGFEPESAVLCMRASMLGRAQCVGYRGKKKGEGGGWGRVKVGWKASAHGQVAHTAGTLIYCPQAKDPGLASGHRAKCGDSMWHGFGVCKSHQGQLVREQKHGKAHALLDLYPWQNAPRASTQYGNKNLFSRLGGPGASSHSSIQLHCSRVIKSMPRELTAAGACRGMVHCMQSGGRGR